MSHMLQPDLGSRSSACRATEKRQRQPDVSVRTRLGAVRLGPRQGGRSRWRIDEPPDPPQAASGCLGLLGRTARRHL